MEPEVFDKSITIGGIDYRILVQKEAAGFLLSMERHGESNPAEFKEEFSQVEKRLLEIGMTETGVRKIKAHFSEFNSDLQTSRNLCQT